MSQTAPKLFLNMILGDFEEPKIVERSIGSVQPYVDDIFVTVTYKDRKPKKSSKLIKKLIKLGANISYFKWVDDFSAARNFAMEHVPQGENHFIYWQDADDVLSDGEHLRNVLAESVKHGLSAAYLDYKYQVEFNAKGEIVDDQIEHKRERVIRHDGAWKWVGRLHETLVEQRTENLKRVFFDKPSVLHLRNKDRKTGVDNLNRNIAILEKTIQDEDSTDPRTLVYLGKAYLDRAKTHGDDLEKRKIDLDLATHLLKDYLQGVGSPGQEGYRMSSGFTEERAGVWANIGEIAVMQGNLDIAIAAYQEAIAEVPYFPEFYADLALAYVSKQEFRKAEQWLRVAVATPDPETTVVRFPQQFKIRSLEASYVINMHKRDPEKALRDLETLAKIAPNSPNITERIKETKNIIQANKAAQSIVFLGKYLEGKGEKNALTHLVQAIPRDISREKFASEMRHRFLPPKTWAENEIAIVCGPGIGRWSPDSIKEGISGSEEAVIYLSKELQKLGWDVTVYANPGEKDGDYDGVTYKDYYEFNPFDRFNVLIPWRSIGLADINPIAKFHMLWMHDVPNNPDFTEERVSKLDKIAVLSEFHKSLFKMSKGSEMVDMPEDKFFLTRNGIPTIPEFGEERDPHNIVFVSSPDRGLVNLLQHWKKVREEVPEATLDIYYGFKVFDALHRNNPGMMQWKAQVMELMKQEGITYHGMVSHEELHKAMSRAGIWAYPSHFEEISCISGMKAQALGSIPVVTDYAALSETVKNGLKVDVNIRKEKGQKEYIEALIGLLKDEKQQKQIRKGMEEWAREYYHWKGVAAQWDKLFKEGLAKKEDFVIPDKFLIEEAAPLKETNEN